MLSEVIWNSIDVLLISETKLDGFTPPYRLNRTLYGGSIMRFIREDLPSKLLNVDTSNSGIENLLVEINLRSKKGVSRIVETLHIKRPCKVKSTLIENH